MASSSSSGTGTMTSQNKNPKRKTKGKTCCRDPWHRDPKKHFRAKFNKDGQPIGQGRVKLASGCGVVARIGNYCSLIHENWSKVSDPMKREIMKYMKERYEFLVEKETYERFFLTSIGGKCKDHKHDLRKVLFKRLKDESLEQILVKAPNGVDPSQWIHLVNYFLSNEGMKASNDAKSYRSHQTYVQRGRNKSFAQIRFDMEEKHGGPISDITFFRVVYMKEDEELDDGVREILIVVMPCWPKKRLHLKLLEITTKT